MKNDNKYFETGTNPYYLNNNSTSRELPSFDRTKPINDYIDLINYYNILPNSTKIKAEKNLTSIKNKDKIK